MGDEPSDDNRRYDIAADEWMTMREAPLRGMAATNNNPVIDNQIDLAHGLFWDDELSEDSFRLRCDRYDPATDAWTPDELPTPTYPRAPGSANGVIDGTPSVGGGHVTHYSDGGFHETVPYVESFRPA